MLIRRIHPQVRNYDNGTFIMRVSFEICLDARKSHMMNDWSWLLLNKLPLGKFVRCTRGLSTVANG